ncbi:MAG TPA: hypothetical protein VJ824_10620 [Bacillota bacterium]|nr:hypothetical protein [Bacillota bacterium]
MDNWNTPTDDFLEPTYEAGWLKKDLIMFDDQAQAEQYLRDDLFGTDGQGLIQEIIEYQG